jgi:hypothetical protein
MKARTVPARHWRSYGDHPLPSGEEALDEPLRAFPSWFLRIVCDRCGKERMVNEAHMVQGEQEAAQGPGVAGAQSLQADPCPQVGQMAPAPLVIVGDQTSCSNRHYEQTRADQQRRLTESFRRSPAWGRRPRLLAAWLL